MSNSTKNVSKDVKKPELMQSTLLGIDYSIGNEEILNRYIFQYVDNEYSTPLFAAHINMHSIALCRRDTAMREYMKNADFHWVDGMPIIFLLRLLKLNISSKWRLTFLDWQHSFFKYADERNLKIFLLGSDENNIGVAASSLCASYPNIIFAYHHGYISSEDKTRMVIRLENTFKPDILLIGMGMPLQETWALNNKTHLSAKIILPIGGYFDYIAGSTLTPPRWLGSFGMEWAARLIADPRKLAYRYLIEPIPVFIDFLKELYFQRK